jgi:hypothetical protein
MLLVSNSMDCELSYFDGLPMVANHQERLFCKLARGVRWSQTCTELFAMTDSRAHGVSRIHRKNGYFYVEKMQSCETHVILRPRHKATPTQ